MPNHCTNRWYISGDPEHIAAFVSAVLPENETGERTFSFERLVPMPAILKTITTGSRTIDEVRVERWVQDGETARLLTPEEEAAYAEIGFESWYDWSVANWGTKWDAYDYDVEVGEFSVCLNFTTAWGPPEEVYDALTRAFPELHVSAFYDEPGTCSAGYLNAN